MDSKGKSIAQQIWLRSARFNQIRLTSLKLARLRIAHGAKCGAARKSDGLPCQNLPLQNGRCRFHGGRTPKGKQRHMVQWQKGGSVSKSTAKLSALEKRQKRTAVACDTHDARRKSKV